MPTEADFRNRGLSQEDEILARVVVDLGLVKIGSVEEAVARLNQGAGTSLGQVLQEAGALSPRFLGAVQKAVKGRLRVTGGAGGKRPSARLGAAKPGGPAAAQPQTASASRDVERKQVLPSLAIPPQTAAYPAEPEPAAGGPEQTGDRNQAGQPPGPGGQPYPADRLTEHAREAHEGQAEDTRVPRLDASALEAALHKRAPKGEGFSVRSKDDVASAWAEYHRHPGGEGPAAGEHAGGAETPGTPGSPEAPDAGTPAPGGPRMRRTQPGEADDRAEAPRHGFRRGRRHKRTGITQSIDVDALREELGIEGGKGRDAGGQEAEAVPSDPGQKEIAVRAFIKRVLPSRLHVQCLEAVLHNRLASMSAARLKQECDCRERDAKRVLETWRSAGVVRQGADEYDLLQYQFTPSRADLALMREFMLMWENQQMHNKLLGWVLEEE